MNNYLSLQHLRKAVESLLIKINEKFNFVNDKVDTLDESFESLTDVAFSGDYNDLSNKPSIPTVPTNISAFNNDAGYIVYDEENYTKKNFPIVILFCDRGVSSFYVQKVDASNYKALIFVSRPHNPEVGSPKYFNLGSLSRLKYSDNLSSSYFSVQSCVVYDKNNTVQENNYLYENKWYYLKATKNNNNNLDVIFYELPFLTNGDIDLTNYALKTDIPENELFIATYGTTTYAEILAAYNANKIIVCKYTLNTGDLIVPFNYYVKPSAYVTTAFHFATVENSNSTRYLLSVNSSNNWSARNNIINALSSANTTIEEGDRIVFTNTNGAYRLASNSSLAFGTATNQYLANNGTWQNIPTSISELTNDSGYITSSDIYNSDWNANENENGYILNKPFYTENVNLNGEYTCTGNGTPSAIIDFDGSDTTLNTLVDSAPGTISITFDNTNYTLELVSSSLSYVEYQDPNSGVDLWLNKNNGYITDFGYISSNNISNGNEYILTISATDVEVIHKLDPKYYDVNIDLSPYMQKGQDYVTAGKKTGTSLGINATAEGIGTTATGQYAHAEGNGTVSSARSAHAEGTQTSASGLAAHTEGMQTTASGDYSHAEGAYTAARYRSQHVFGEYNILEVANTLSSNRGTYVEIVGNGTSSTRSNARTLDWFGNEVLAGKLTVGTGPTNNMDVATKQYVDTAIGNINGFEVAVVNSLPTENIDTHTFYFMSNSGSGNNIYDEYLYINNTWEKIGSTEIDLSGYLLSTDIADWAKASTKPSYTASEVGALADTAPAAGITSTDITNWNAKADISDIPTSLSDLTNDPGYITSYTETDPIFSASVAASITSADITNWNNKLSTAPVTSVNGQTGDIVLGAADVGALADSTDLSVYMQKGVDYVTAGQKSDTTLGVAATAEGYGNTASGHYSHAEGRYTTASGIQSHAEGYYTNANGNYSHAEGCYTTASGIQSHAEGWYTTAQRRSQHVFGEYNVLDTTGSTTSAKGSYIEIVGKGASNSARSNARTLDWSGNEVLAGKLTLGAGPTANMDAATKQYVDTAISNIPTVTDTNTTYTISMSGNVITLTPSSGIAQTITLPVYNGGVE